MKENNNKPEEIDKQIIFAEQYLLNNRNATLAYKNVYGRQLSDEVAAVNASKLLRITKVKLYLQRRFNVLQLDSSYVLKNLKNLAERAKTENVKLQANVWIGKAIGMFSESYITQESEQLEDEAEKEKRKQETQERIKQIFGRFLTKEQMDESLNKE
jgi:hypothetical protein